MNHCIKGTAFAESQLHVIISHHVRFSLGVRYVGALVTVDEMSCSICGQLNGVKVQKMRWLGNVSVNKEYRSMVVYMDTKEEVDGLLA